MSHEGHSHSHNTQLSSFNRAFLIGIVLNSLFVVIEFVIGYSQNSLALIADATHNLSDVGSLLIALLGMRLMQKKANEFFTFGFKKASILASLINGIVLMYISIEIGVESIKRLNEAPELVGAVIIVTALIGVLINTFSAFLFLKGQKDDINMRGAFLHLILDAVVSVGVVISGIIIYYTGWNMADSLISIVIAVVIMISTFGLFKESVTLVLDGTPRNVDFSKIKETLLANSYVEDVHHLHIWALSSMENALTGHVLLNEGIVGQSYMEIKEELKAQIRELNIKHVTLELDYTRECLDRRRHELKNRIAKYDHEVEHDEDIDVGDYDDIVRG